LGYLAMYLGGKLGVFDHRGHSWKLFPVVLPILGAAFVAITRVDDYWHHWTDVCTGAAIGRWKKSHLLSYITGSLLCPLFV
jgi:diacylglycerol diphosphate phosphatase/phosphatidate phosphatase